MHEELLCKWIYHMYYNSRIIGTKFALKSIKMAAHFETCCYGTLCFLLSSGIKFFYKKR